MPNIGGSITAVGDTARLRAEAGALAVRLRASQAVFENVEAYARLHGIT